MILNFKIEIKDGSILNPSKLTRDFIEYMKKLNNGIYNMEVKKYRKNRSKAQNSFFHGPFLTHLAKVLGCDELTAKDEAKRLHLSVPYTGIDEQIHYKPLPTSNLTTVGFENFISRVRGWINDEYRETLVFPHQTEHDYEV